MLPPSYHPTPDHHMKYCLCILLGLLSCGRILAQEDSLMVRIAEIEIHPDQVDQYTAILKEEARASVQREPGVITIFPMFQKDHPNQVRILEIYASRKAYEAHLRSPHFLKYKSSTQSMVASLKLVDMLAMDAATMPALFRKLTDRKE